MSFQTSSMNFLAGGVGRTGEEAEKGEGQEHVEEDLEGGQEFPFLPLLLISPVDEPMVGGRGREREIDQMEGEKNSWEPGSGEVCVLTLLACGPRIKVLFPLLS